MKTFKFVLLLVILSGSAICQPAIADDKTEVKAFLETRLNSVTAILRDTQLTEEIKKAKILDIINPAFDFEKLCKNTLGREHWPPLDQKQRKDFVDRFTRLLRRISLDALLSYSSETIIIEEPFKVRDKIHVPTFVLSDEKITIVYKFYQSQAGWMVYDIEVNGVSITRTYRSQFDEFLQTKTIDELVLELDKDIQEEKS